MYRRNGSFPWADMKATIAFWIIVALIPCYNIFHDIFLGLTGFLILCFSKSNTKPSFFKTNKDCIFIEATKQNIAIIESKVNFDLF